jgi:Dolichyl-phosphate-mannose-protein mannosyltransferase
MARPHVLITRVATVGLLLGFLAQCVVLVRGYAPTYDEAMHVAAGYSYLARRDFRLEPQNPPLLKILFASPIFLTQRLPFEPPAEQWRAAAEFPIGQSFLYGSRLSADWMLALARIPNVLLGVLLLLVVGWWASRLWGLWAALVTVTLTALDPTVVAHSSLVTTDTGASLFFLLTLYLLWEHARSRWPWYLIGAGVAMGLALGSKYSNVVLPPIVAIVIFGEALFVRDPAPLGRRLARATRTLFVVLVLPFAVIPMSCLFCGLSPWWSGFLKFLALGSAGVPSFFLGQYSSNGWWAYFPVAFLIKTPVGSLVLILASFVMARRGAPLGRREALFLLVPVIVVFAAMTQARINIGVRHVLPVYPLLFVLAARVATIRLGPAWLMPLLVTLSLALAAASALRVAPHQLAYFNELVGGPARGHRYLSDSNLDWGQDLKRLGAFMDREGVPILYLSYFGTAPPAYYGIRYQYVPGSWPLEWPPPADRVPDDLPRKLLAISVSNLQEVQTHSYPLFTWLRMLRPAARIGHSIHIYDLTGDTDALRALGETYRKVGLADPSRDVP